MRLAGSSLGRKSFPKHADRETMSSTFYTLESSFKNIHKGNSKGLRMAAFNPEGEKRTGSKAVTAHGI